jgi:membrane-associated PAP2 superfamily phosphatase
VNRKVWTELGIVLLILVLLTAIVAVSGADLTLSGRYYSVADCSLTDWPVGEQFPWKLLYRIDRTPALVLAIAGLVLAVAGLIRPRMQHWVRPGFFLVLLLALGPGLVVNAVLKEHWGRPRPREIMQFDGSRQFQQPWQPAIDGSKGRSFPSGHASAAFYMTAPFFIYRRKRPLLAKCWLAGGMIFGLLMSFARITQGGHFLSDTIWAWGIVHLVAIILAALLLKDHESGAGQ